MKGFGFFPFPCFVLIVYIFCPNQQKMAVLMLFIQINNKTQIVTPTQKGEAIFDIVRMSMQDILNPKLTASWEKGLDLVAKKEIKPEEFMQKLEKYIKEKFNRLITMI